MLRCRLVLMCIALGVMSGGTAPAQVAHLQRLDIGDTARQWQAVGRLDPGGRGFVSLGAPLADPLRVLQAALRSGQSVFQTPAPQALTLGA